MKEIKFRALDKTCGEFTNIEYLDIRFKNNGEIEIFEGDHIVSTNKTNDYELMQYTGLKDKNGKEIYEGDIIKHSYRVRNTVIKWDDKRAGWSMGGYNNDTVEVIGNIYENPELLKEGEENEQF